MIVKMDKMSTPSSRGVAQCLYDKNAELENERMRSAKAKIPSDPNAWQQMRENYEAIILEDHAFSEQHNIEYALWQLHYRRIEEFRAHFSAALSSMGSTTPQGGKGPSRPARNIKIRAQFKTFLSEATGFYHDLVLKVRAKYGLPLGHFSEEPENHMAKEKGGKKSSEVKKGLISCHRCLIYLGDLARYKGLYGEGDSKIRDYAAASSYYLQAASLLPSSGNPHHQLAILASYSGDELRAVYCYFRSLAVDCPFSTARDNLIVAFEKNRQSYSHLHGEAKAPTFKESRMRASGKVIGKGEAESSHKDTNGDATSSVPDMYKAFCIRFVRLNGILFTRTSLETFAEVLSLVSSGLLELLASGTEEELNFGEGALESGLVIVRLISILIFTVHNVNKQAEGQTYAKILQRNILLQNACTALFEFMGHILNRCTQLRDASSSYLLPAILVFLEWLACCPEVAAGSDEDENLVSVRSVFWTHCVSLLNKLVSNGLVAIDEEDDTCFTNMSRYDEEETDNRLALWEDFELRGFLPLLPAQTILDFSRKHSFPNDGSKDKKVRVRRVVAAGKALAAIVRVGEKKIYFDSVVKKFIIGVEPPTPVSFNHDPLSMPRTIGMVQETSAEKAIDSGDLQLGKWFYVKGDEEEDDDEVIVFKPTMSEKQIDVIDQSWAAYNNLEPGKNASAGDMQLYGGSVSFPPADQNQNTFFGSTLQPAVSLTSIIPQHLPQQSGTSTWFGQQKQTLANGLKCLNILESTQAGKPQMQEELASSRSAPFPLAIQQPVNVNNIGLSYGQARAPDAVVPSKIDSAVFSGFNDDSLVMKTSSAFPPTSRNPVSRPVRHNGPPPGFNQRPLKQVNEAVSVSGLTSENPSMDDCSWLDGYQMPKTLQGLGLNYSISNVSNSNSEFVGKSNGISGTVGFPFPGKQVPALQFEEKKQNLWQDYQAPEHLKLQYQQQFQQQQLLGRGNPPFTPLLQQFQGSSIQTGPHFV